MIDRESVLDAALDLAARDGWDAVHLHDVAHALDVPLGDLHRLFEGKDAVGEALFDRADRALLQCCESPDWLDVPVRERLERAIWAWLAALAPHRQAARAILRYRLQPEHVHLQVLGAKRVSRTVQWFREAARIRSTSWRREVEEAGLTAIYLAVFARWLFDDSPMQSSSQALLHRLLAAGEAGASRFLPD